MRNISISRSIFINKPMCPLGWANGVQLHIAGTSQAKSIPQDKQV